MKTKEKTCKACKKRFVPIRQFQCVCNNWECAAMHIDNLKRKKDALDAKTKRKAYQDTKNKLKSLTELANDCQVIVNRWIREVRDKNKPCISCGKVNVRMECGHYRSRKAAPHLRFHEDNMFGQCHVCNHHLSSNAVEMRKGMIERIGVERVEAIENNNEIKRWTKEELEQIKQTYGHKLKDLKNNLQ